MRQILQNLKTGAVELVDIPCPMVEPGQILISTRASLISAGTERMLIDFGKGNLVAKARQQPDKVRMVLEKAQTDGLATTFKAVQNKLDQPLALGYCNAGVVIGVGAAVEGFSIGDRVASNGKHAEIVSVPEKLCAKIPDGVGDEDAAFTVISAIALQGVRLAVPTLGEAFVVTGLGLIGLITVQILRAHGCKVMGIDLDDEKLEIARRFGAITVNPSKGEDPIAAAKVFSKGRGVDGVLVTASTNSSEPVQQAAQMCRKRGRIVLVGVTGLELSRADFYEKELTFQVSCSYGPGRYDPAYEDRGHDYPIGFVRWTEQRNFEAVLEMISEGRIYTQDLISHRIELTDFQRAYDIIGGAEKSLGIVLRYPDDSSQRLAAKQERFVKPTNIVSEGRPAGRACVGFIGAGNYAGQILIPAFREAGATLHTVLSSGGVSGHHVARKYGFQAMCTELGAVLDRDDINAVVIATRHDRHAEQVCAALRAGKHVFVEKPLALTKAQLEQISEAYDAANDKAQTILMVGFNRRFAPQVLRIKSLLEATTEPKSFVMTVNAGYVSADHWTQSTDIGGGRILGEACHYIDLLRYLVGYRVSDFNTAVMLGFNGMPEVRDTATMSLIFEDGSTGTIHYFANGHKAYPKERLEVFCAGRILQLDNFRKLRGWGWRGFRKMNLWRQDKGNENCVRAFVNAVRDGQPSPTPFYETYEVSRLSIELAEAVRSK